MSVLIHPGRDSAVASKRLSGGWVDHRRTACEELAGRDRRHRQTAHAAAAASLTAIFAYAFVSLHGGLTGTIRIEHIDLDVYRLGARMALERRDLYGPLPAVGPGIDLQFTYPPIAAVLLAPLAVLPLALDGLVSIALTVTMLVLVLRTVLRAAGLAERAVLNRSVLIALPAVLILDPVRVTLADGQIDVALMGLVVWDTLGGGLRVGRSRPRGLLVGLAAAVKLTPLVFVLYFLARRERRAAATALAAFGAFTALGFMLAPGDSAHYWRHAVFETDRIGSAWYAANQSVRAVLTRFGLTGSALTLVWVLAAVAVVALAWTAMRRPGKFSAPGALIINALAELLISPISWTHLWVWIVPGLAVVHAAGERTGRRPLRILAGGAFALFALGPQWLLPHGENRELHWALWEQFLGSAYVWFALAMLITAALPRRNTSRFAAFHRPIRHA